MSQKKKRAFTLIELVVVITIVAILGTIAFISMNGYAKSARNSARTSDLKLIDKALSVYNTKNNLYPSPDNSQTITYSGAELWTQGIFGSGAKLGLRSISDIPIDPHFDVYYSYSVAKGNSAYQLGSIVEDTPLGYGGTQDTYAATLDRHRSQILGNYIARDIKTDISSGCRFVTVPSIFLSERPAGNALVEGGNYFFSIHGSSNIPESYIGVTNTGSSSSLFNINTVLDSCSINNLAELELYVARLSTSYQALTSFDQFNSLIFNFYENGFKHAKALSLQDRGVDIHYKVLDILSDKNPEMAFRDLFMGADGTSAVSGHVPNSGGSWSGSSLEGVYTIQNNTLTKSAASTNIIFPEPIPSIGDENYRVQFDIKNFGGGSIETYLRFLDVNNYYVLEISDSGYRISQRIAGVTTILQDINEPINIGDRINFGVSGSTLVLNIGGISKGNIIAGDINSIGKAGITLGNNSAAIDNFILYYR